MPEQVTGGSSSGKRTRPVRRIARVVWLLATAGAVAYVLRDQWEEISRSFASLGPVPLASAAVLGLAGVGTSFLIWHELLKGLGQPFSRSATARIFFVGQLGKYLPGSIWPVVAQAEMGRDLRIPPRTSVAAVATFLWLHLITGCAVAVGSLVVSGTLPAVTALLLPILGVVLVASVMNRVLRFGIRVTRREPLDELPDQAAVNRAAAWSLGMWACYAGHLTLLIPSSDRMFFDAAGAMAGGWVLGFLFLVAPAGAGARETAIVTILSAQVSLGSAVAAALLSRLLLTAADAVWGVFSPLMARRNRDR